MKCVWIFLALVLFVYIAKGDSSIQEDDDDDEDDYMFNEKDVQAQIQQSRQLINSQLQAIRNQIQHPKRPVSGGTSSTNNNVNTVQAAMQRVSTDLQQAESQFRYLSDALFSCASSPSR